MATYANVMRESLAAGRAGEQEYLSRLRAFNPVEGLNTMAAGAWGSISDRIQEMITNLRGQQAGMGRGRSRYANVDEDRLWAGGLRDLGHAVSQGALQAQGQQLGAIQEWGGYASGRMGQGLNLMASEREHDLATKLARRENRSNILGSLIGAGGTIAGAALMFSDQDLKENIEPVKATAAVRELRGVEWDWNEEGKKKGLTGREGGVIAQDVERVRPELVHRTADGTRMVDYGTQATGLVGVLVESNKDLDDRIRALEAKLAKRRAA